MMKSGDCTIMWNGRDQAQAKWTTIKHTKGWSSPIESDVVYIVGLEESPPIWASSGKANNKFQQALLSVRLTESSIQWKASRISQQKIIFQQGNIRLHVYLMIRQRLLQAGWQVLIQLPYSPDIASLDFHWFWSSQNSFSGKKFNSLKDCSKRWKVLEDRITKLPEKWQMVVGQKGQYGGVRYTSW